MAIFNFGQTANKFLPWNPPRQQQQLGVNKFDPNVLLPGSQQAAIGAAPPRPVAPSLAEAYARINANRPNRLAYEQAVQQGTPQIERGKLAKLGAIIAASATGFGKQDAEAGTRLGLSAYNEPQRKADAEYEKRMFGLERMAGMEDTDKARELEVAKAENDEFYKKEAASNQRADYNLRFAEAGRQEKLTDVQIKNIEDEMRNRNIRRWTNPEDGFMYELDGQGKLFKVGQAAQTPAQKAAEAGGIATAEEAALQPGRLALEAERGKNQMNAAREGTSRTLEAARIKAQQAAASSAERLRAQIATMRPDDQAKQMLMDILPEVEQGRLPSEAPDMIKWVNGSPTVDAGMFARMYDSETADYKERQVRGWLSQYIQRMRANQQPAPAGRGAAPARQATPTGQSVNPSNRGRDVTTASGRTVNLEEVR